MDKKFNLKERTLRFALEILSLANRISTSKRSLTLTVLTSQFVRAGTSIGANYREADCAESRKDFIHKIGICKKEANETKYWLELLAKELPSIGDEAGRLSTEADELTRIFVAIVKKTKNSLPGISH